MDAKDDPSSAAPRRRIRAPQDLAAGAVLVVGSLGALWATRDVGRGHLAGGGPGFFPRAVAALMGLVGVALLLASLLRRGEALTRWALRGPLFVTLGVAGFALTIRSPGLLVAGPLVVIVGGAASPEARYRELVLFAVVITAFCAVLFRYLLHLPVPILVIPGVVVL
ncbi:MAG TPA: tripartite tricarboxylate transporter TctB family protein [Anaeromyxobacteraceae bacterium]